MDVGAPSIAERAGLHGGCARGSARSAPGEATMDVARIEELEKRRAAIRAAVAATTAGVALGPDGPAER